MIILMTEFWELLILPHTTTGIRCKRAVSAMHVRQKLNQAVLCKQNAMNQHIITLVSQNTIPLSRWAHYLKKKKNDV